jgi:hypothetical protein
LGLQLQLESARPGLKTLDKEVQQRLLNVVKPSRITLFTQGHGERTFDPIGDTDRRPGVRDLRGALEDQGHSVRDLGPAEGLATDVPKDATLVMVLGPTKPFSAEEIGALQRFLARGGRLFLALDPDGGVDLHELLDPMGVKVTMKMLANDQVYARRTHQDADRANLVTGLYSSHPSVSTLSRQGMRAPVVLPGAMAIEAIRDRTAAQKEYTVDFTVHAHFATFPDVNGNFQQDQGEERKAWELAAAISNKKDKIEQRVFLVGDSEFLTDQAVRFAGNGLLVLDPVRWLIGEESWDWEPSLRGAAAACAAARLSVTLRRRPRLPAKQERRRDRPRSGIPGRAGRCGPGHRVQHVAKGARPRGRRDRRGRFDQGRSEERALRGRQWQRRRSTRQRQR